MRLTIGARIDYNIWQLAEVAKWQTRYVQDVVPVGAWEFESPLRHNNVGCSNSRQEKEGCKSPLFYFYHGFIT
jgi:hypothetical protein